MLESVHQAFSDFVILLRNSSADQLLRAPSFSHSLKDPVTDDIAILPHHRVVLFEGLYANVDEGEWAQAAKLYDERWVVECNGLVAKARLIARHVVTGVAKDVEEAVWRGEQGLMGKARATNLKVSLSADNNDMPNGRYLMEHVLEPCLRLKSIDDSTWQGFE